jgi:hypothetical protein
MINESKTVVKDITTECGDHDIAWECLDTVQMINGVETQWAKFEAGLLTLTKPKLDKTTVFECFFTSTNRVDESVDTTTVKIKVFEPPKTTVSACKVDGKTLESHKFDIELPKVSEDVIYTNEGEKATNLEDQCPGDKFEIDCDIELKPLISFDES